MILYSKHEKAVLLFHRILPLRDPLWDPIDPALFAQTLNFVQKKFHVVALDELLFNPEIRSTKPLAAITFDDGYRDFIDYAIPVLDKERCKATMFVVTDCIDSGMPTWTYMVDHLFINSKKLEWKNVDVDEFPDEYKKVKWDSREEKILYCKGFKQWLKWIPSVKRDSLVKSLLKNFDDIEDPGNLMMSWAEVRQVYDAGFGIGSHSVSHPTLATIADDGIVDFELNYSARRIKEKSGINAEIFSYPVGNYDQRIKKLTRSAGYSAALAVNKTMYDPDKHDLFEVPRIELYNESWLKTRMRINGSVSYVKRVLGK